LNKNIDLHFSDRVTTGVGVIADAQNVEPALSQAFAQQCLD
jgi:hypothetical protein